MTRLPKRNTAETKTRHQMLLAFAVVSMGVLLVFVSFSVPPTGIIDASVLAAFGEMLTFAGSLIGIDYHYRYKSERYGEDEETAMYNPQNEMFALFGTKRNNSKNETQLFKVIPHTSKKSKKSTGFAGTKYI